MTALGNKQIMADNISFYMKKNKIDRNQLCEALDFKYSTVSEWLSAKKYPRIDSIEKMARYFNIPKSQLIEKNDHKIPHPKMPPYRLDLFGSTDESENIELLQDINNQVKDNPTNADDEMDTLILEIYKRLPEKKRKKALLTLLDLLKK